MRRGLCSCNQLTDKTCGGIPKDIKSAETFIHRISKILNLKNPRSVALLEGHNNNWGEETLNFWIEVSKRVLLENEKIEIHVILDETGQHFFGLKIIPRNPMSVYSLEIPTNIE